MFLKRFKLKKLKLTETFAKTKLYTMMLLRLTANASCSALCAKKKQH